MMVKKKKTILIIEDEYSLQKALKDKLAREGFRVITAMDGIVGFQLIRKVMPDLVLLDLVMPEMDGFGVLNKVKSDPETRSIPILVVSNSGGPDDIKKLKQMGIDNYIVKAEFTLDEVMKEIKKLLRNSAQREREREREREDFST